MRTKINQFVSCTSSSFKPKTKQKETIHPQTDYWKTIYIPLKMLPFQGLYHVISNFKVEPESKLCRKIQPSHGIGAQPWNWMGNIGNEPTIHLLARFLDYQHFLIFWGGLFELTQLYEMTHLLIKSHSISYSISTSPFTASHFDHFRLVPSLVVPQFLEAWSVLLSDLRSRTNALCLQHHPWLPWLLTLLGPQLDDNEDQRYLQLVHGGFLCCLFVCLFHSWVFHAFSIEMCVCVRLVRQME